MAKASRQASAKTELALLEGVKIPVSLYTTKAEPGKLLEFVTAGPNGHPLVRRAVGQDAPVEETPPKGDPLADSPLDRAPGPEAAPTAPPVVPAEYVQKLFEEGSGEVVEPEDVRRGIRTEDGTFIDCTANLAKIEADTKLETMEVVSFIDAGQVDRSRVQASYYVAADEPQGNRALLMIFEAMRAARRVAVVRWTARSRQSLGVMVPSGRGEQATLKILKLTWAEDYRGAPKRALAMNKARVSAEEVAKATELVQAMSDTVDSLDELRDDAIVAREELREQALAGEVPEVEPVPEPEPEPEIDLADAFGQAAAAAR